MKFVCKKYTTFREREKNIIHNMILG